MATTVLKRLPAQATSIDEVVNRLSAIVQWAAENDSRMGYFAALYRKVTVSVRDGIRNGLFADPVRMERFDVVFANRYIDAFDAFRSGFETSSCWKLAFQSSADFWPIVLQHLLLGMNAHINLDLGIAAAQVMRGEDLESIHGDFDKINGVLASLVGNVQNELAEVWVALRLLNPLFGNVDDAIINFSMKRARDEAWKSAQLLRALPDDQWAEAIAMQDSKALIIGKLVRRPGSLLSFGTRLVRLGEVRNTRKVIGILT